MGYSKSTTDGPDEVDPSAGLTDLQRAKLYYGARLREDNRLGYNLDGRWVRSTELVEAFLREAKSAPRPRAPQARSVSRPALVTVRVDVAVTDDVRLRLVNLGLVTKGKSEGPDALRSAFAKIIRDRLSG